MRRHERNIEEAAAQERIIRESYYMSLGMLDGGQVYVVPLNFGYEPGKIYVHCAREGRKMDILRKAGGKMAVFALFVGKAALLDTGKGACGLSSRYASVMAEGMAEEITDDAERLRGMRAILRHVGATRLDCELASMSSICMLRITVTSLSAKMNDPQ